ncbi:TPA: hypothetical protein TXJ16_001779 [Streptococcus suis]|nr:hypothetical protein [Streptococcus suis]
MSPNEFRIWIESLVNELSGTDWWANAIAIFCAIIGITVPILVEIWQRRKIDKEIREELNTSIKHLATISEELREGYPNRVRLMNFVKDICDSFERIDNLINHRQEEVSADQLRKEFYNLRRKIRKVEITLHIHYRIRDYLDDFVSFSKVSSVREFDYKKYNQLKFQLIKDIMDYIN